VVAGDSCNRFCAFDTLWVRDNEDSEFVFPKAVSGSSVKALRRRKKINPKKPENVHEGIELP
jgi:hypothetical protein